MSGVPPDLAARLAAAGQEHLVDAVARAPEADRGVLLAEVAALDLDLVDDLVRRLVRAEQAPHAMGTIEPAEAVPLPSDGAARAREREMARLGEGMLRAGRVAVVLLAGGQGTRLGFDGPKGDYPFGPVTGRTLFSHHAAAVQAVRARYGCALPWYLMTSPANDGATRRSFAEAGYFGLPPDSVRFIVQGTLPAVDRETGRVLLDSPGHLALSPDGHGGLFMALRRSGALDRLAAEGVSTLFTFQVDNPLSRVAKPVFIGHHVAGGAEMSSLVVRKRDAAEKVGVIARIDGHTGVVEYSDLPDELAAQRGPDGGLRFWAGNIAMHCIEVPFAMRLTEGGLKLPYHRALKRVPHVGEDGAPVSPESPNAVKFETFIFDALPLARASVTLEVRREEEFSPIKNAEGADSPESCRRDCNRLYAGWLRAAGVEVPDGPDGEPVDLEIDPRLALDADELARRLPPGTTITGPTALGPDAGSGGPRG
jgi:UDP-N-acetylglucosamine/UDP-N-acetylgalactosamine diphosphorylase